jgi:hypothetical protein
MTTGQPVRPVGSAVGRIGLLFVAGAAALAAIIEVLLTPLYLGSVLFPITVLLAIATNIALPMLARELVDSTLSAAVPVIVWFLVAIVLGFLPAHGSVLLPGGGAGQTFASLGTVFLGVIAGSITMARTIGPGLRAQRKAAASA